MNAITRTLAQRQAELSRMMAGDGAALQLARTYAHIKDTGTVGFFDPASEVVETDDSRMMARFVITRMIQDRDGDIVVPNGIRLDNYRKNPTWFFGHQQMPFPIGTAEDPDTGALQVECQADKAIGCCYFDEEDPDAVFLYGKVKRGFLRMTSIGFMPLRAVRLPQQKAQDGRKVDGTIAGWRFDEIDLLEISLVGVPANPEACLIEVKDQVSPRLKAILDPSQPIRQLWDTGMSKKWGKSRSKKKELSATDETVGGALIGNKYPKWDKDTEDCVSRKIPKLIHEGYGQAQAAAIAYSMCGEGKQVKENDPTGIPQGDVRPNQDEFPSSDVQAILFPKSAYPSVEDCVKYLEAREYDSSQLVESETEYCFEQFPAEECQSESARVEDLGDGIQANICQRSIEEEGGQRDNAERGDRPELVSTNQDHKPEVTKTPPWYSNRKPCGCKERAAMNKDASNEQGVNRRGDTDSDANANQEQDGRLIPHGALFMKAMLEHHKALHKMASEACELVEHPKVNKAAHKMVKHAYKNYHEHLELAKEAYPEHLGDEETPESMKIAPEESDETAEEAASAEAGNEGQSEEHAEKPEEEEREDREEEKMLLAEIQAELGQYQVETLQTARTLSKIKGKVS